MVDDDEKPKPVFYGSAGMAAAGMMPGRTSPPASEEEVNEAAEPEEEESVLEETFPEETEPVTDDGKSITDKEESTTEEEQVEEAPIPAFSGKYALVIGHTGAGDFGNGLDKLFLRLDGVRLAALTDCNAETYEESATHAAAPRGFSSYSAMLEREEDAELCCIAPSWTNERYDMLKAALEADKHILCGCPFTATLKEADELLALAEKKERRVAVTGLLRADPLIERFHSGREALIGNLLEMHVYGAMGIHSGGEDLIANSLPLLDLVRFFGGEPEFASSVVSREGMPVIADDSHEAESRDIGPLLGDAIHAQFLLESGVRVTFTSDSRMQNVVGRAGIRFVGTDATMRLYTDPTPSFSLQVESQPNESERSDPWTRWPAGKNGEENGAENPYQFVIKDWLSAIDGETEPVCSAENASKALEMAHAIWQSALTLKRAYFPLSNRLHPLAEESR